MDRIKKTVIGKDVIESLTLGMYEDSKFIYREYVQNAADQIDKAAAEKVLLSIDQGEVWIKIDKSQREISIEDNATGIKSSEVFDILRNIAQSPKQRGVDKGFRGIGRLGGLGYCDKLTFITSFKGEATKSVMTWDAKELKHIINNRATKEEASDVIDSVTAFYTESEKPEKHYFQVVLENVSNDTLLDKKEIRKYLQMVAPVPLHPRFIFNSVIHDKLKEDGLHIDEYKVYVNTEQLFKAYTTSIYEGDDKNKRKIDEIFDVNFFKIKMPDNKLLGWSWYGISRFFGVLPEVNLARGIRLRKDNIQIGMGDTLARLHKQKKNNFYFFGEVHAFNPNLIPNARRDYFLENIYSTYFENELIKIFDLELKKLFNIASKIRSAHNAIKGLEKKKKEIDEIKNVGITNKDEREKLEKEIELKKKKAEEGKKRLENFQTKFLGDDDPAKKIYDKIVKKEDLQVPKSLTAVKKKINELPHRTEKYSKLTKNERKLISKLFQIIDEVLTKDIAENLKRKIDEKFQ